MLVSVIVPTRNRAHLLRRVLRSALHQEGVDAEAVIVDDASSDDTQQYLATIEDDRLRYYRNDEHMGVAAARNRGIAVSRGEWIAFLDDDDLWAPTKLRSQIALCTALGADFSYTGLIEADVNLVPGAIFPAYPSRDLEIDLLGMNVIGTPSSLIIRRTLLERVGYFDPEYSVLADWDLLLRLATAGRAAPCDDPLTAYVVHRDNMHLDAGRALSEFRRLRLKHAGLARSRNRTLGNERWWGWIARSYRRSGDRYRAAAVFLWLGLRFSRPRDLARGVGMLFGESAMALGGASLRSRTHPPTGESLAAAGWLQPFRDRA